MQQVQVTAPSGQFAHPMQTPDDDTWWRRHEGQAKPKRAKQELDLTRLDLIRLDSTRVDSIRVKSSFRCAECFQLAREPFNANARLARGCKLASSASRSANLHHSSPSFPLAWLLSLAGCFRSQLNWPFESIESKLKGNYFANRLLCFANRLLFFFFFFVAPTANGAKEQNR